MSPTERPTDTRLDLAVGVFLLGGAGLLLGEFGLRAALASPSSAGVVLSVCLAGVLSLLAGADRTPTVAGRRLDRLALRGGSQLSLGAGFVLLGTGESLGGGPTGTVAVGLGVLTAGSGLWTVARSAAVREGGPSPP